MNFSCPTTSRMGWLCSSKLTSGEIQCTKLRPGLGEHNTTEHRFCVDNYTHNLSSAIEVKQKLFQELNAVNINPADASVS